MLNNSYIAHRGIWEEEKDQNIYCEKHIDWLLKADSPYLMGGIEIDIRIFKKGGKEFLYTSHDIIEDYEEAKMECRNENSILNTISKFSEKRNLSFHKNCGYVWLHIKEPGVVYRLNKLIKKIGYSSRYKIFGWDKFGRIESLAYKIAFKSKLVIEIYHYKDLLEYLSSNKKNFVWLADLEHTLCQVNHWEWLKLHSQSSGVAIVEDSCFTDKRSMNEIVKKYPNCFDYICLDHKKLAFKDLI